MDAENARKKILLSTVLSAELTSALIEVIDSIYRSLDSGKIVCGVFLDLQKAFDTVQHNILLHKLFNYGVREA